MECLELEHSELKPDVVHCLRDRVLFRTLINDKMYRFEYVLKGGCLSDYDKALVSFLRRFYMPMTLVELRDVLTRYGYKSKSGLLLEPIHVSNFLRKDLCLRKVREYEKPNYKGFNWTYFK